MFIEGERKEIASPKAPEVSGGWRYIFHPAGVKSARLPTLAKAERAEK